MTVGRIPNVEGGIQPTLLTTTGDIIYASSASNPARLGIGTANQVLRVNSGATAPEWATPASGGMTLLSTTTLSGATVTISSISQSYNILYAVITGITSTTSGRIRCAPNASTTQAFSVDFDSSSTLVQKVNTQAIDILGDNNRSTAANSSNGVVLQIDAYTGSTFKPFSVYGTYNGGSQNGYFNFGGLSITSAITSLVFSNPLGNLSTGTVLLYGVK